MGGADLRLEREPPVAWDQHLDPDVGVGALDQITAVFLLGSSPVAHRDACRQPERANQNHHRSGVVLTEPGSGLRDELEQIVGVVGGPDVDAVDEARAMEVLLDRQDLPVLRRGPCRPSRGDLSNAYDDGLVWLRIVTG